MAAAGALKIPIGNGWILLDVDEAGEFVKRTLRVA
jgi:hypothetical protein